MRMRAGVLLAVVGSCAGWLTSPLRAPRSVVSVGTRTSRTRLAATPKRKRRKKDVEENEIKQDVETLPLVVPEEEILKKEVDVALEEEEKETVVVAEEEEEEEDDEE